MKKTIFLMLALFMTINYTQAQSVKIKDNSIIITNFSFSYVPGLGLDGYFPPSDKEVFKKLKGKSGYYNVVLISDSRDSYGKKEKITRTLGTIDATELSKYENYAYWARKTGGTKKLFLKYYHY